MKTNTYYFPCNQFGRHLINYMLERVSCSVSSARKVADTIAVTITTTASNVPAIERILQTYNLM